MNSILPVSDSWRMFMLPSCWRSVLKYVHPSEVRKLLVMMIVNSRCNVTLAYEETSPQDAQRSAEGSLYRSMASKSCSVHRRSCWSERLPPPYRNQQEDLPTGQRHPYWRWKGEYRFLFVSQAGGFEDSFCLYGSEAIFIISALPTATSDYSSSVRFDV